MFLIIKWTLEEFNTTHLTLDLCWHIFKGLDKAEWRANRAQNLPNGGKKKEKSVWDCWSCRANRPTSGYHPPLLISRSIFRPGIRFLELVAFTWFLKRNSICALTFPSPVSLGGKSDVASIFPVKFCHQGFVRVSYDQNTGVKRFNLLFAALVRLNADGPPATPVVSLPFKPCETVTPPRSFTTVTLRVNVSESQTEAHLYYRVNRQSNSCPCRSRWPAQWGGESKCFQLRGNWQEPPDAWLARTGSGGPCSVYLMKVKWLHDWTIANNHWQTLMLPTDTDTDTGGSLTRCKCSLHAKNGERSQKVDCGRLDIMTSCDFPTVYSLI